MIAQPPNPTSPLTPLLDLGEGKRETHDTTLSSVEERVAFLCRVRLNKTNRKPH
jgi:hypothetical protein